jgi:tape measure domain-containing protein
MKVGSVFTNLKVDTTQFKQGLNSAQQAMSSFAKGSKDNLKNIAKAMDESTKSVEKFSKSKTNLSSVATGLRSSFNNLRFQTRDLGSTMDFVGGKAVVGLKAGFMGLGNILGDVANKMATVAKIGTGIFAGGLIAMTGYGLKMGNTIQQASIAFDTMLGSVEGRQKLMKDITDFAKNTPFERFELIDSSKLLLAMGVSADKIIPSMKMLGDISAGVGANVKDVAFVFGQVKAQGQAYTQDLNQFATRGIPVYEELAKVLGISVSALRKGMTDGKIKVGFQDIETAFGNLTNEGGKFYNLMDKQSKSMGGILSNLKDNMDTFILRMMGVSDEGDIRAGSIFDIVSTKLMDLKNWMDANGDVISAWGSRVFTAIGNGMSFVWDSIIAPTLLDFQNWFNTGGKEAIKSFLSEGWDLFKGALIYFRDEIWPPVRQALGDFMNWLKSEEGKQAMRDIAQLIRDIGGALLGIVGAAAQAVKAITSLGDKHNSVMDKMKNKEISSSLNLGEMAKNGPLARWVQGRATGGTVQAGKAYEVGERDKPEMFMQGGKQYMIAGNRGKVLNENQMGSTGGGNLTVNLYSTIADQRALSDFVRQIKPLLKQQI